VPYLTVAQVRQRARSAVVADDSVFSDEEIEDYIAGFEDIAERYCGVAFIPRAATHTEDVCRSGQLILQPRITAVSAFTVDETASTIYEVTDSGKLSAGLLPLSSTTTGAVSVTYTHGYATCPKEIERACIQYVRACALRDQSDSGRDVIAQGFDGGTTRFSTPDWDAGRPTGYIEVDRILNSFGRTPPGIA
jgi:hypothetical protein